MRESKKKTLFLSLAFLFLVFSFQAGHAFKINMYPLPCARASHETITSTGLSKIAGWSSALNPISDSSADPDLIAAEDPAFHFTASWSQSTELIRTIYGWVVNRTFLGEKSNTKIELGWIMHIVEDFYAHSNWVENHDFPNVPNFDGPTPSGFVNWGIDFDCSTTGYGIEAEYFAEAQAYLQFQRYLKECYRWDPAAAEAKVTAIFPGVNDLKVGPLASQYDIAKTVTLYWNNYSFDPVTLQISKDGTLLGTINSLPTSLYNYGWVPNLLLSNGSRVLPGPGYRLRTVRGAKSSESSAFQIIGLRCTSPLPSAIWKRGTSRTITFRGYRVKEWGTDWNVYVGAYRIGTLNIDSYDLKDYNFSWIVGTTPSGGQIPAGTYKVSIRLTDRDPETGEHIFYSYPGDWFSIIN